MKKEKLVFKNSKKQKLAGILYSPYKLKDFPIAIFCHGYRSSKESNKAKYLSETLTKRGIGLFSFDFSGNGESEGKCEDTTVSQYIDDLKCAVDLMSKKTKNIAFIGSSLGGLVSLNAASKDKRVKTLALISPLSHFRGHLKRYLKRVIYLEKDNNYKVGFAFYVNAFRYMRFSKYKKINIPTLILHGNEDKTVKIKDSIKLNSHIKSSKLIIIKGADHWYSKKEHFNKVINKTTEYLVKNLK
jgi:uncharacterized protein